MLPITGGTLTGPLNAPTPPIADNSTKMATTAFVNQDKFIPAATDLNTILAPGTYACQDNTCTNGPSAGGQWYLHVQTYAGAPSYLMQRAVDLTANPPGLYVRTRINNTWSPWVAVGSGTKGQIPGTATNDNAAAGCVGEILSATNGGASGGSGASFNICSITLTPGDWDVSAIGMLNGAPLTMQSWTISVSTTSATLDATIGREASFAFGAFTSMYNIPLAIPPTRFSVTVNTVVYLVGYWTYNAGGGSVNGGIRARRMR